MAYIAKKLSEKSTVAGILAILANVGLVVGQGLVDPVTSLISGLASLYLVVVDEKK